MRRFLWIAIPTLLGANLAANVMGGSPQQAIDLTCFHSAASPRVVVHAISVQRMMRVQLTKERFDPYVDTNGADYVLTILDPGRSRRIAQLLEQLELKVVPEDGPTAGVRYRLRFLDGDTILQTLYISPFGEVVDDKRVLRPVGKSTWIREFWEELQRDLVIEAPEVRQRVETPNRRGD